MGVCALGQHCRARCDCHASQTERRDLEGLYLPVPKILPRGYSMAVGLGRERITDILERSGTARTDRRAHRRYRHHPAYTRIPLKRRARIVMCFC